MRAAITVMLQPFIEKELPASRVITAWIISRCFKYFPSAAISVFSVDGGKTRFTASSAFRMNLKDFRSQVHRNCEFKWLPYRHNLACPDRHCSALDLI